MFHYKSALEIHYRGGGLWHCDIAGTPTLLTDVKGQCMAEWSRRKTPKLILNETGQWVYVCHWNQAYILDHPWLPQFPYVLGTKNNVNVIHTSPFSMDAGRLKWDDTLHHILKAVTIIQLCAHCFMSAKATYTPLYPWVPSLHSSIMKCIDCIKCLVIISVSVYPLNSSPTLHKELWCCTGSEDWVLAI